jgi:hypothetical protein
MPVLFFSQSRFAGMFFFLKKIKFKIFEEVLHLFQRIATHVGVLIPGVSIADELSRETTTGDQGLNGFFPEDRKLLCRAKLQAKAGVNQVYLIWKDKRFEGGYLGL